MKTALVSSSSCSIYIAIKQGMNYHLAERELTQGRIEWVIVAYQPYRDISFPTTMFAYDPANR
jgi:hypothetical protein